MNHRIRELAEQAGADFIDASKDYFGDSHPAGVSTDRIDLQKFAELLIRECAGVCVEQRQYQPKEVYAQAVLSHFGVEE